MIVGTLETLLSSKIDIYIEVLYYILQSHVKHSILFFNGWPQYLFQRIKWLLNWMWVADFILIFSNLKTVMEVSLKQKNLPLETTGLPQDTICLFCSTAHMLYHFDVALD